MTRKSGISYLLLAFLAFVGIAVEGVYAFLLEPAIYQAQMQDWTTVQSIIHWTLTCITWGLIAALLIQAAKKKLGFDLFADTAPIKRWQWIGVAAALILAVVISYLDWQGFKVIVEFQSKGPLLFVFQYVYYLFETLLFTLIIIFGQKAFESWFQKENFPFGGILAALTWGIGHSYRGVWDGVLCAVAGFLFGVAYLLVNRDFKKTTIILYLMFVL